MIMKLTSQERKDLDRFTRFLVLKSAQVIVDSRLGNKTSTQCKHASDGYGFNVAVPDLPEVLAEAKRALNSDFELTKLSLCVEISLRTVEGDHMVLECWCLGMLPEQSIDYAQPFTQTVYSRMGVLLKSLVSVTRVTPAYKMSRRQSPDSYIILYRIYMGEPVVHVLGDDFKEVRIGQLCTPIGTMHLTLSYRTKMTITPTTERNDSIMLKSDHFTTNFDPTKEEVTKEDFDLGKGMKVGAFAVSKDTEPEPEIKLSPPFTHHIYTDNKELPKVEKEKTVTCNENGVTSEDSNGNSTPESQSSNITMVSTADDFIMVDLKMPFAKNRNDINLGMLQKDWEKAPSLQTFKVIPTFNQQVPDLNQQLETFEADISKYDDMVLSLCQSPNNN